MLSMINKMMRKEIDKKKKIIVEGLIALPFSEKKSIIVDLVSHMLNEYEELRDTVRAHKGISQKEGEV